MSELVGRDQLLGLDETSIAWRRQLCEVAWMLADAVLVGNPAPKTRRTNDRLRAPQPGDYVYETSTFWLHRGESGPVTEPQGCGFLERIADEVTPTDELWAQWKRDDPDLTDAERNTGTERVYYVRYGPAEADVCRWVNAEFRVVPLSRDIFDEPMPFTMAPDGSGVFTRASLVGSLADSGFAIRDSR